MTGYLHNVVELMLCPCPAAELIKRRILGLHQNNQITSIAIQDTWEPIEVPGQSLAYGVQSILRAIHNVTAFRQ